MGRLPLVVAATVLLLAGCSGDEESDATPSDAPTAVEPGPTVAFGDLEMVPEVSTYTRDFFDDSAGVATFAGYTSPLEGGRVAVEATDYVSDWVVETVPGFVPAHWQDADDLQKSRNGWTCGTLGNGPGCYRPLQDGMLETHCALTDCTLGPSELSDVSAMLYEAFTGGSTSGGSSEPPAPCDGLDADEIAEALGEGLGEGDVELVTDESEIGEFYTCIVDLPVGSLGRSDPELHVVRHEYAADTRAGSAECAFGGSDPDEVHESAAACLEQDDDDVEITPADDDAGGTVVSPTEVVQAEEGVYWWEIFLADDTFDGEQFDVLSDLAGTLPAE